MNGVAVDEVTHLDDEVVGALASLLPQLSSEAALDVALLEQVVAHPSSALLVARLDGAVVGTTTLVTYPVPAGWRAHVDDVVVSAQVRGRGVGEALVRAALARAEAAGVRSVELTSRPSREAAIRLYERLGFQRRETGVFRFTPQGRPTGTV